MKKISFKSFCKVNLFLKILGKKQKMHVIQSLATICKIFDEISVSENKKKYDEIIFIGKFGKKIDPKFNTIKTTLKLLRSKKNLSLKKFKILIKKNIPHGSGLGGGSGNAAYLMQYLNLKYNLKLKKNDLFSIAKKIGSDVPFFLAKKNHLISEKHNKIKFINNKFLLNILVVFPNILCATKKIYSQNRSHSEESSFNYRQYKNKENLIFFLQQENNDLEKIVVKMYPKINKLINFISSQKGCYFSRITGSGSACIGVFSNYSKAIEANKMIKRNFPKYWSQVSKTM